MRTQIFSAMVTVASRIMIHHDRVRGVPGLAATHLGSICTQHGIPSGNNVLDAALVEPVGGQPRAALLICHGIGETVEHWRAAQQLLAEEGVTSLVFNYSGYARSTGWVSAAQCERDTVAAFGFLAQRMPGRHVSLLGFSLGSGIAAAVVARVPAHRLVLCAVFTSLREAAELALGGLKVLSRLMPAIWNTEDAVRTITVPILIVQGEEDRLFPPMMARRVAAACGGPHRLIVAPEVSHNSPIEAPERGYWARIADCI